MKIKDIIKENDSGRASPVGSIKPEKKKLKARKNVEDLAKQMKNVK